MRILPLLVLAAAASLPCPASAAESYDSCTGTIASLPATISTQGVWCMDKDLATTISVGNAVAITANNVTIDCNHFKLGGLGAGPASSANGIYVDGKSNTVIRNCNIRGFYNGVMISGNGSGHVIEDNRFDGNLMVGINVAATLTTIRRNLIIDTGTSQPSPATGGGIFVSGQADVIDNTIDGVSPTGSPNANARGILFLANMGSVVEGNRIRNVFAMGTGTVLGITFEWEGNSVARGNILQGTAFTATAIHCNSANGLAADNVIIDFTTAVSNCASSGNVVN